jgi:hypothetical protein
LRSLGENIQNQPGAIEHPALQGRFQVSFLGGRQGVIKQHHVDLLRFDLSGNFLELTLADKSFGRRLLTRTDDQFDIVDICRMHQVNEFGQIILIWLMWEIDVDQKCAFAPSRSLKFEQ